MLLILIAAEWWFMYGNHTPTLRNLAIKVLSQTASSSACERNWSTFALIHTKQRNRLAYPRLQQLVFCYYNMKLKIRDMQAESYKVARHYLDLLDISVEFGEEEDNQLFQWVRPLHLDMKMEILIHELLRMFKKLVLMLTVFYLKKLIVKVSVKTREIYLCPLLILDPHLIQVLNIVVDLVLPVLQLQTMMAQEERGLMMVVILEMMVEILQIDK